jgi:lactate dehydrogenase-like 2-hydroxyacid dehydrogenase
MKSLVSVFGGVILGIYIERKVKNQNQFSNEADKYLYLFLMMKQWVKIKQERKSLAQYLYGKGYKEIAIYGMGHVGEVLAEELLNSDVMVKYGIDRDTSKINMDFNVVTPDDKLDEVDAIVVTSITYFSEVEEMLNKKVNCPVISLEDILYEI